MVALYGLEKDIIHCLKSHTWHEIVDDENPHVATYEAIFTWPETDPLLALETDYDRAEYILKALRQEGIEKANAHQNIEVYEDNGKFGILLKKPLFDAIGVLSFGKVKEHPSFPDVTISRAGKGRGALIYDARESFQDLVERRREARLSERSLSS
ncbi:MAG: hypothetical protein U1E36_00345 [Rickettsiales bacterium]